MNRHIDLAGEERGASEEEEWWIKGRLGRGGDSGPAEGQGNRSSAAAVEGTEPFSRKIGAIRREGKLQRNEEFSPHADIGQQYFVWVGGGGVEDVCVLQKINVFFSFFFF